MPKPSSKSQRNLTILSIALLVITLPQIAFAVGPVQTLLLTVVHGFFGTVAGGAGLILDYSIGTFVVGFGELYESSGLGFSIDNLWRILIVVARIILVVNYPIARINLTSREVVGRHSHTINDSKTRAGSVNYYLARAV